MEYFYLFYKKFYLSHVLIGLNIRDKIDRKKYKNEMG